MIFNEEVIKRCSCGPLLKKRSCGGRVIKIETLDVETAERINRRVSACARQHVIESHATSHLADNNFRGPVKVLKFR